jgi:hypothetical protein
MRMIALIVSVFALGGSAGAAAASVATGYVRALDMQHTLESHGFRWGTHRFAVNFAHCRGLRRYGVQGVNRYHRFDCRIEAADGSVYVIDAVAVSGTRYSVPLLGIVSTTNPKVGNCLDYGGDAATCLGP